MNGKRYLKNTMSAIVLQIITIISGLIIPIIVLQAYGSTLNGLMNSIKQFIGYLTLVEAGISTVSIAALYKPISTDNKLEVDGIVSASRVFYNKVGVMFSLLVVLTAIIFPYFLNSQVDSIYTRSMILVIGLSGTMEYFFVGKYRVLLTADQKGYIITNAQIFGVIMNTIATIILIKLNYGLIAVQFISGIIYLMRAILIKRYIEKEYKNVNFYATPNIQALSQRGDALIHQIASMVVFNTDILLLTLFSTLSEVSVYSVYRIIFTAISSLVSTLTNGLGPALGNMINDSNDKFLNTYRVFENIHYMLLAFVYSVTFILYIPFLKIYTANITDANYIRPSIMVLFLIAEVMNQIRIPANILVNVKGLFKDTKNRAVLEATINLLVSLLLVKKLGIVGVLIGTICSYSYRTFDFIVYTSKKILNSSSWISIKIIVINISLSIVAITVCKELFCIDAITYLQWVKYAIKVSIVIGCILISGNYIFNHKQVKEIKKSIYNKIKYIIKK